MPIDLRPIGIGALSRRGIPCGMSKNSEITILTVDDHPLIRDGLAAVIAREPDMRVVAEAGDGEQALEQYRAHQPSVVLMDLRMPVMDGVEAIQAIRGEFT